MRRIPRLAALLLAALLLIGATGCGSAPPEEPPPASPPPARPTPTPAAAPEFVLPCYPAAGFHPITGSNRTNLALAGLIYEGLFELDGAFVPQNRLCASYTVSEDGLVWTFALREGVAFSDGSPLTAADAVYSLNLARDSALYGARLAGVRAVAAGQGAVTVTLAAPSGGLPALLDIPIVKMADGQPLGTGPYALIQEGEELALAARGDWWQGKALPKSRIPLHAIHQAGDLIHAFDTRAVSLVSTDLTGTNTLGFSGSYEAVDYPTSVMLYVGFNCAAGPCREEAVRQALQRSFDRETVAAAQFSRHALPAALPAPPGCPLYDAALAGTLDYAPQAAEELLLAAGWSRGEGVYAKGYQQLALTFLVPTGNGARLAAAEAMAQGLVQAGFVVDLQKLPWEDYLRALERGDFDLYLGEVRMIPDFDPAVLLAPDGALNYGGYRDGEAEALLAALQAAQGEARHTAAGALYRRLAQSPAFAVVCFKSWSALSQWNQVAGLTPTQQNLFYGFSEWKIP